MRPIRDEIRRRVERLVEELVPHGCPGARGCVHAAHGAQPLRAQECDGLFRNHPAELQTAPGRAVLTFRGGHVLALLVRDLADRESACCSFFRFEVTAENGAVRLTVEVPPERQDGLDALVVSTRSLALAARPPEER